MTLSDIMEKLVKCGCYPCISYRGISDCGINIYRAHINACGNYWEEASTPHEAMKKAYDNWVNAGQPMDGMASPILK